MLKLIILLKLIFLILFNFANANENLITLGKKIYDEKGMCLACHSLKSTDKKTGIAKNMYQLNPTSEILKNVIINGKGSMPALGNSGILSNDEIEAVIYYIKKKLRG
jgi:cytochrome c5